MFFFGKSKEYDERVESSQVFIKEDFGRTCRDLTHFMCLRRLETALIERRMLPPQAQLDWCGVSASIVLVCVFLLAEAVAVANAFGMVPNKTFGTCKFQQMVHLYFVVWGIMVLVPFYVVFTHFHQQLCDRSFVGCAAFVFVFSTSIGMAVLGQAMIWFCEGGDIAMWEPWGLLCAFMSGWYFAARVAYIFMVRHHALDNE